jgi:hypothetical protein
MIGKAGLEWKTRGYPFLVKLNNKKDAIKVEPIEWCADNLEHGTWIRTSHDSYLFSTQEHAVMFDLAWGYDNK